MNDELLDKWSKLPNGNDPFEDLESNPSCMFCSSI